MGDLRNKIAKIERAKRDEEAMERLLGRCRKPKVAPPPSPAVRCKCGLTCYETTVWAIHYDRRHPTMYFCPICLPDWVSYDLENGERQDHMCNLYSLTKSQQAIRDLVKAIRDLTGNLPPLPAIFPNRMAPVVRTAPDGVRELIMMRWGFPPPNIPGSKPRNPYLTNVRNTDSRYWQTYLKKPENRCLVPATSFAEPDNNQGPKSIWTWFAQDDTRPLMFFPGIWREWEGDRGTKAVPDIGKHLVFSFLTTDASQDVAPVHSDATPVCLLDEDARETWMNAPWELAQGLQKPPRPGALKVVARDTKQDPV